MGHVQRLNIESLNNLYFIRSFIHRIPHLYKGLVVSVTLPVCFQKSPNLYWKQYTAIIQVYEMVPIAKLSNNISSQALTVSNTG